MGVIGTCKSNFRTPLHVFGNLAFGEEEAMHISGAPKEKARLLLVLDCSCAYTVHGRCAEASRKGVACHYLAS